jgi:hypothetical protein
MRELVGLHRNSSGGMPLMNRFFQFLIVAFFATCLAQAQAYGPPAYDPPPGHSALAQRAAEMGTGKWWIRLPDDAKDKLIERYTKAMNHVSSDLFSDCAEGIKSLPRNGADEADIVSNMILCKIGSSFDFSFDHKELREGVDSFYKDSANLSVPVDVALQRVRDALAAKRPRGQGIG